MTPIGRRRTKRGTACAVYMRSPPKGSRDRLIVVQITLVSGRRRVQESRSAEKCQDPDSNWDSLAGKGF